MHSLGIEQAYEQECHSPCGVSQNSDELDHVHKQRIEARG
jgi:hypothetical protein